MRSTALLFLLPLVLVLGCEEDEPVPFAPLQHNEFSSQWPGEYHGTVCLNLDPRHGSTCDERPAMVRLLDVGENHVRISVFMEPPFAPVQETVPDVLVQSGTSCNRVVDDHEIFRYQVRLTRAGDMITGGVTAIQRESGLAEWTVTIQTCTRGGKR